MSRTTRMISKAAEACLLSDLKRSWVGAVVAKGSTILSASSNRSRNTPGYAPYSALSYHAEVAALRMVGNAQGCTVYVARTTKMGELTMARPCRRCRRVILNAGISRAVWTDWNGTSRTERVTREWVLEEWE